MENIPMKKLNESAKEEVKFMEREKEKISDLEKSKNVEIEKIKLVLSEAESRKKDLEKIGEIEKELGLKLENTKKIIRDQIEKMKKTKTENIEPLDDYQKLAQEKLVQEFPGDFERKKDVLPEKKH